MIFIFIAVDLGEKGLKKNVNIRWNVKLNIFHRKILLEFNYKKCSIVC